jgi:hypothetical protein
MPLAGCAYALWAAVAALPALAGVVCFPPRILSVSRGEVLPAGVDRRSSGLGSASSAGA